MVSARPYFQILDSSYQSFGDSTERANYNWYHHHFHIPQFFVSSLTRSRYLFFFSLSCNFTLRSAGTAKSAIRQILFFMLLIITRSGRLTYMTWPVCCWKSQNSLSLILQVRFWVLHIPFIRMVKLKFLAQLKVDHLAHPVEFSLFCCVLSILALIWLVFMALFWAAIWIASFSHLRLPLFLLGPCFFVLVA